METLLPALVQVPFIAAFIWFAVRMSTDYREDACKRATHWMEFLALERSQRKEAMDQGMNEVNRLTESMYKLTESMGELAKAVFEHDTKAMERYNNIKEKFS
jgi:Na+/phosphate symporter